MSSDRCDRGSEHAAGKRGGRLRQGIGKMLGSEAIEAEGRAEEAGVDCRRHPEADECVEGAVEEKVGTIERRVGELIGDAALMEEGAAREVEGAARRSGARH